MFGFKNIFIIIFLAVIGLSSSYAACPSTSRVNSGARDILTSTKYNGDLNTIYTFSNGIAASFDGACLQDDTVTFDKLDSTSLGVLLDSVKEGCKVTKSDDATLSVDDCMIAISGVLVKTTSADTVTWGCSGCASEAASTTYYLYAKNTSTDSGLVLDISTTPPDEIGYNSTSRILAKVYNNASSDFDACAINQWINNGFSDHACREWSSSSAISIDAVTTAPTKGNTTTDSVRFRRIGDSMQLSVNYVQLLAGGAVGSGTYLLKIPGDTTIDTTKVIVSSTITSDQNDDVSLLATGTLIQQAGLGAMIAVYGYDSTQLYLKPTWAGSMSGGANSSLSWNAWSDGTTNFAFDKNMGFNFIATIPIAGWDFD